jgi:hypothetical protein
VSGLTGSGFLNILILLDNETSVFAPVAAGGRAIDRSER